MNAALVTIAVGERHRGLFDLHCRASFEAYARRYGYAPRVFTDLLAPLPGKSPSWQKLFLLQHPELRGFNRIIFLDADIVIHPAAPDILADLPAGRLGFVPEIPAPGTTPADWHRAHGVPPHDVIVQGGVLCLEPGHHDILTAALPYPETPIYEMPALSHVVGESGLGHPLDPRFNALVPPLLGQALGSWMVDNKWIKETLWQTHYPPFRRALRRIVDQNWFLHAAGAKRDLARIAAMLDSRAA